MRALLLAFLLLAAPASARELTLATWNIAWLTLRPAGDRDLPREVTPRSAADLARLREYAARLDADVIALQEVDGPEAASRVFDPARYVLFFTRERDVQRTGFAVRREVAAVQNADLAELDTRPNARFSLRRGADITVGEGPARLRLLSVHLDAGCRDGPLDERSRDCETLADQARVLARWSAERAREGVGFAILGDFNRRMEGRDPFLAILQQAAPLLRTSEGRSDPCHADARGTRPFIDHILLGGAARERYERGSLRVLVYAERGAEARTRLSDHCPVAIRLRAP
jgi:endonuclease/exonuclease/phosphatase family metal-dependent hydrolase